MKLLYHPNCMYLRVYVCFLFWPYQLKTDQWFDYYNQKVTYKRKAERESEREKGKEFPAFSAFCQLLAVCIISCLHANYLYMCFLKILFIIDSGGSVHEARALDFNMKGGKYNKRNSHLLICILFINNIIFSTLWVISHPPRVFLLFSFTVSVQTR